MNTRLENLIASAHARELDLEFEHAWDRERSERVRAGVVRRREVKSARERLLRRGALVASGAGLLVVLLLRVASSAPAELADTSPGASASTRVSPDASMGGEVFAVRASGDGGYARD